MSKNLHTNAMDMLLKGVLSLKNMDEAYLFFEDLCTVGELEALQQRFEVALLLRKEKTYQEIAETTGASTATISRVNRALNYGNDGYDMIFERLEEES
jgi:TrpR-related protein YerC/YecD